MNSFSNIEIQKVKDFWNKQPCNIKHSNKDIGTKEYFDEIMAKKFKVEPHIISFSEFDKYKDKTVLEIGCGLGTMSTCFAKAGANITMVELSEKSLELCRQRFFVNNLSGKFYLGNCEELSKFLPEQKFDLIYSFGVIHHTPNPKNAIDELSKYLKVGGELKLMLYSKYSYKLFWIMKETNVWDFSKLDELISTYSEAQTGCPVTYSYTFDEIKDLLGKNYEIQEIYKDHIFPYKIEEYKKHNYVLDDCFKDMTQEEFSKMERDLGWHTMVKAVKI